MILQTLVEYYDQLLEEGVPGVAKPGWCPRSVSYMLDLSPEGELAAIVPAEDKRGWQRMVPEQAKRTVGIEANLLCDNASYLLGVDAKGKPERSLQCFAAARERHIGFLGDIDSEAAIAIRKFFESWNPSQALEHPAVVEAGEGVLAGGNLVFSVAMNEALADPSIRDAWDCSYGGGSEDQTVMTCLVTGKRAPIARLHSPIKGIVGAQSMGASLVGFNARAFESYGHDEEQGLNAPVSEYAMFAYTTALNYLLADRKHHIRLGDTTIVYWADRQDEACAETFFQAFNATAIDDEKEDPDVVIDAIMKKLANGTLAKEVDVDASFYVLGLAPNAARVSVRFFLRDTFGAMLENVQKHYDRLEIVHAPFEKEYISPYRLLAETANPNAKDPAATSVLGGALMRSILQDLPYPPALYTNTLLRIQASQDNAERHTSKVTRGRGAIVKAYLLKNFAHGERDNKEVATVALDDTRNDAPYVLGRLFSVLEGMQEAAYSSTNSQPSAGSRPSINVTIKNRYFNSASSTPATIFPLIIVLSQAHSKKIKQDRPGLAVFYEKQIAELCDRVADFPKRLTLEERGAFILGYYQQRQDRFSKPSEDQEA